MTILQVLYMPRLPEISSVKDISGYIFSAYDIRAAISATLVAAAMPRRMPARLMADILMGRACHSSITYARH